MAFKVDFWPEIRIPTGKGSSQDNKSLMISLKIDQEQLRRLEGMVDEDDTREKARLGSLSLPHAGIGSTAPPSNLLASNCAPQSLFWQSSTGWGCQSTMPRVSAQPASVSATSWVTTPSAAEQEERE